MFKRTIKKFLTSLIKEICESKAFQEAVSEFIKASADLSYTDAEKSRIWNKLIDAVMDVIL